MILIVETLPAGLEALINADKMLSAQLFATVAGLALTASAFAFTAAIFLEDRAAEYRRLGGDDNVRKGNRLSDKRKDVLTGGISLIAGFSFWPRV